jgi:hypothetical protein
MNDTFSFLAGVGLGAGLMYVFDPQMGRRRRALARDKAVRLAHEARDAADVVRRDMTNRAHGLAHGDLSVLAGGKRALQNPLRGGWSPSARALMVAGGAGLFAYGLTCDFPVACVLGTAGLALAAEGVTNAGVSDLACAARGVADKARDVAGGVADAAGNVAGSLGLTGQTEHGVSAGRRETVPQAAGAGM